MRSTRVRWTTARRTLAVLVGMLMLATGLVACGGEPKNTGSVQPQGDQLQLTLGTKDFTEQIVLGELYAQALRANGYKVVLRRNVGPTEVIDQVLLDGDIDAYPEYLGVTASVVAGQDLEGKSAEQIEEIARDYYAQRDQVISEVTPFENQDALATTFLYSQENRIRTISDLRKLDEFTLAGRDIFRDRQQGFRGLQRLYGLTNAEFLEVTGQATYNALDEGDADVINVFTTDPQLADGRYLVLEDDKSLFAAQHVAVVMNESKLKTLGGDKFMSIVNAVNAQLSNRSMMELNRAVDMDGRDPAAVAERFLRQNGLLTPVGG